MKKFPRGYKTYKIMQFVQICPRTNTEIRKYAYELTNGKDSYDKVKNRGYWCTAFQSGSYYNSEGCLVEKLEYEPDTKRYHISEKGLEYLDKYDPQFYNIVL
jgi:hypothetical protein